jgi:hypothetical protein
MAVIQPIQLSETSTKQGILQDIDFICGTTATTFPTNDKVRLINLGLDNVADLIMKVSDNWVFDDTGQTTLPIGYADTTANTGYVSLDVTWLKIKGVYWNSGSEKYVELSPTTEEAIMTIVAADDVGDPSQYCLIGNKIYLKPIPNTTTTGNSTTKLNYAIKVQFERNLTYFDVTGTTATVNFNPQFTRLATYYACRDYAIAKGKQNLNSILMQIDKMERALQASYAHRNKKQLARLTPAYEDNR